MEKAQLFLVRTQFREKKHSKLGARRTSLNNRKMVISNCRWLTEYSSTREEIKTCDEPRLQDGVIPPSINLTFKPGVSAVALLGDSIEETWSSALIPTGFFQVKDPPWINQPRNYKPFSKNMIISLCIYSGAHGLFSSLMWLCTDSKSPDLLGTRVKSPFLYTQ